jgi:hypothetical protein
MDHVQRVDIAVQILKSRTEEKRCILTIIMNHYIQVYQRKTTLYRYAKLRALSVRVTDIAYLKFI